MTSGAGAIQAHYRFTYADDDHWYAEYDVVTVGEERARVDLTVPVDNPVTVYHWIWDGHRVLESGENADDLEYTLYEAPAEEEGLLQLVTAWIVDPESEDFATECPDAEPLESSKVIAGREGVGYRCHGEYGETTLWIDAASNVKLRESGLPGEGSNTGVVEVERIVWDAPVDDSTFSTDPPSGVDVDVVESTGKAVAPPQEPDSAAELEAMLRDVAATTSTTTPIYYVGPEFAGERLSDVVIFNASGGEAEGDVTVDPGQSLVIIYGGELQVETTRYRAGDYRGAVGCRRVPDLRGVPAVQWSDATVLFSEHFVIRLGDTADTQGSANQAAHALRRAEDYQPTGADLPPPPASVQAVIAHACGATPGDHGRPPED